MIFSVRCDGYLVPDGDCVIGGGEGRVSHSANNERLTLPSTDSAQLLLHTSSLSHGTGRYKKSTNSREFSLVGHFTDFSITSPS